MPMCADVGFLILDVGYHDPDGLQYPDDGAWDVKGIKITDS